MAWTCSCRSGSHTHASAVHVSFHRQTCRLFNFAYVGSMEHAEERAGLSLSLLEQCPVSKLKCFIVSWLCLDASDAGNCSGLKIGRKCSVFPPPTFKWLVLIMTWWVDVLYSGAVLFKLQRVWFQFNLKSPSTKSSCPKIVEFLGSMTRELRFMARILA